MRFQRKSKQLIALTAAAVLTAMAILPRMYLTPHAACSKSHEWTGLKLYWTDIPAATGGDLRWPRKTYFDGGTGIYKGMDNSYCFCVANHTGQAGKGQEAYLQDGAGALLIQDYALFKGNRDVRYENKPFYGFCGFMSEQDALFERLARERNITVEEMKEIISARILKGWNDTNPIK